MNVGRRVKFPRYNERYVFYLRIFCDNVERKREEKGRDAAACFEVDTTSGGFTSRLKISPVPMRSRRLRKAFMNAYTARRESDRGAAPMRTI